jgi:hypothetical protein
MHNVLPSALTPDTFGVCCCSRACGLWLGVLGVGTSRPSCARAVDWLWGGVRAGRWVPVAGCGGLLAGHAEEKDRRRTGSFWERTGSFPNSTKSRKAPRAGTQRTTNNKSIMVCRLAGGFIILVVRSCRSSRPVRASLTRNECSGHANQLLTSH